MIKFVSDLRQVGGFLQILVDHHHLNYLFILKVKEYVIRLFLSTLSFRGIPTAIACKLRHERMEAIGDELSKGEYYEDE
jgi:hypothetical protein